jgi:hypothetical protein
VTTLNLGEHEVRFRAVDERGIPLAGTELDLEEARSRVRHNMNLENTNRLFLHSGNYRFYVRNYRSSLGLAPTELTADIEADTLITIVLSPSEDVD